DHLSDDGKPVQTILGGENLPLRGGVSAENRVFVGHDQPACLRDPRQHRLYGGPGGGSGAENYQGGWADAGGTGVSFTMTNDHPPAHCALLSSPAAALRRHPGCVSLEQP